MPVKQGWFGVRVVMVYLALAVAIALVLVMVEAGPVARSVCMAVLVVGLWQGKRLGCWWQRAWRFKPVPPRPDGTAVENVDDAQLKPGVGCLVWLLVFVGAMVPIGIESVGQALLTVGGFLAIVALMVWQRKRLSPLWRRAWKFKAIPPTPLPPAPLFGDSEIDGILAAPSDQRLNHLRSVVRSGLDGNVWWIGADASVSIGSRVVVKSELPMLVLGPTGSGKTTCVVIQNALLHKGAAVITSTKGELLDQLAPMLLREGRQCSVFDPLRSIASVPEGVRRVSWDVLTSCADWGTAQKRAELMVAAASSAARMTSNTKQESGFWEDKAYETLTVLLYGCAVTGRNVRQLVEVVAWLGKGARVDEHQQKVPTPFGALGNDIQNLVAEEKKLVDQDPDQPPSRRRTELELCLNGMTEIAGTIVSGGEVGASLQVTVSRVLSSYRSAAVLEVLDHDALVDFDELVANNGVLFLVSDTEEQKLTAPLFVGLLNDVVQATYRANRAGGRRETLLLLDELAQLAPLQNLPALVSEGRGKGLRIMAILQNLAQARAVWGDRGANFPTDFPHVLVLPGLREKELLESLELVAGKHWYEYWTVNTGPGGGGTTWHAEEKPNLSAGQIASFDAGEAAFFSPEIHRAQPSKYTPVAMKWIKINLVPSYEEPLKSILDQL